jgi:zinc transport system ATP-binding protein
MDEPTAGVDARSQAALAATLHELAGAGRTVVLVAHDLGPLEPLITRTVELDHGRIVHETAAEAAGRTA